MIARLTGSLAETSPEGAVLDVATYERIGGVRKAIARRAESLYSQLQPAEQETARQLFLRIATVSGDIVGRRRVPASELVSLDVDVIALRAAIDAFARYRLLDDWLQAVQWS